MLTDCCATHTIEAGLVTQPRTAKNILRVTR
jgi:hypothetical protein